MKCVIMAGGKGTRISSVANDIPKPMIPIGNKTILEIIIENISSQGINDFIITVGYLGQVIIDYLGNGEKIGVNIEYYFEKEPLGNAGALLKIKEKLVEDFLLVNGDIVFDVDIKKMISFHIEKKALATILTHPNSHPYDSGIIISENNEVKKWLTKEEVKPEYYKNRTNAGIHIISPILLEKSFINERIDLDRDILRPLAGTGNLYSYDSPEYVKDMGTPDRYAKVCEDYKNGLVSKRNIHNRQKAIFLDRDGTINKYVGFLRNIDEFELLPEVSEAIRIINSSEYLVIVVTNQPVIARGEISQQELELIHNKMETLLGNEGAFLNDIYYCPHHPDKGFKGEIIKLKKKCNCRKPQPGLLIDAANKYNIDLSQSWMIGDSKSDIEAGKNAGCKTALVNNTECFGQDIIADNLLMAIRKII